ncbi:hypothetical protein [Aminobacter sp. MSH1]|uniref:hypothetical protein n=1 Tax=Aminobacter sp. MSH1 TaxID=374606 RepID=UPI000D3A2865|nr:hypothetical protein [Aminobacter sp. MSH1]
MAKLRLSDTNMARPLCNARNSVLETELELAAKLELIATLAINETPLGYYVTAMFAKSPKAQRKVHEIGLKNAAQTIDELVSDENKIWYLTTRRERNSPRLHKHLGRLNDFMRERYPTDIVLLLRNQAWPGKPAVKTRGARTTQAK